MSSQELSLSLRKSTTNIPSVNMPVTRIGLIAVPDAEKQELAIKGFGDLSNQCKKVWRTPKPPPLAITPRRARKLTGSCGRLGRKALHSLLQGRQGRGHCRRSRLRRLDCCLRDFVCQQGVRNAFTLSTTRPLLLWINTRTRIFPTELY